MENVQATQEYGDQIKALIEQIYDCCFVGEIEVKILPNGFQVLIGLPSIERPFSLAADLPWDDFLIYFKNNLKRTPLWDRYTLELTQPNIK